MTTDQLDTFKKHAWDKGCTVYEKPTGPELLIGGNGEMQLPITQGYDAAYEKANVIAENCGYVATTGSSSDGRPTITIYPTFGGWLIGHGRYILVWTADETQLDEIVFERVSG